MGLYDSLFVGVLKNFSGDKVVQESKHKLFNSIIAFKGVVEGVGCSTIVANTALALAAKGLNVCVVDTSILYTSQRYYLNVSKSKTNDWFDLASSSDNIFDVSKFDDKISVLSFKERTIVDLLSLKDSENLVAVTYRMLTKIFDVVLVDLSHETTNISTAAAVHAHIVYQVTSNDLHCLSSMDKFLQNMVICSCPLGKLRNVIINKSLTSVTTDWRGILGKYMFTEVVRLALSLDVAELAATSSRLYGISGASEAVKEFCKGVDVIVETILYDATDRGVPVDLVGAIASEVEPVVTESGDVLSDIDASSVLLPKESPTKKKSWLNRGGV